MNPSRASRVPLGRDLLVAALLIGVALALRFLSPDRISVELSHRLIGVLMGAVLILYSNEAPKLLPRRQCSSGEQQNLVRFAGWSLLLGGLAYALTWLLAPIGIASLVSTALLGSAVLLVLARFAWSAARRTRV